MRKVKIKEKCEKEGEIESERGGEIESERGKERGRERVQNHQSTDIMVQREFLHHFTRL